MSTKPIPYITFYGDCKAAVEKYIETFGGKILYIAYFSEENCDNPEHYGKIMHVEFMCGETQMSALDKINGEPSCASRMRLMVHVVNKEVAEHTINVLSEYGKVLTPLQPHSAPDNQGMGCILKDEYGIEWIVECPNPDYVKKLNSIKQENEFYEYNFFGTRQTECL